jgi:hypothetical protein
VTVATQLLIAAYRTYLLSCNELILSIPVSDTTDNNIEAFSLHDLHYAFTRLTGCELAYTGAVLPSLTAIRHHSIYSSHTSTDCRLVSVSCSPLAGGRSVAP